jgi:hypothetical protein
MEIEQDTELDIIELGPLKDPEPLTAERIAEAFNTASNRGAWRAVQQNKGSRSTVTFDDDKGMVKFIYVVDNSTTTNGKVGVGDAGLFLVQFRKTIGNFGDYANAIARGLASILSALQAAGLPFHAPQGPEGVEIIIKHHGVGNMVSARYLDPDVF